MKKIGFLLMVMGASYFVSAQNVQFGLKGGVNIASINDEARVEDAKVTPRIGFHVGGLAHIHLNQNWALQPEVVYSTQGAKYAAPYEGVDEFDYVNVPVLLQYMAKSGFRVETGPQVGFNTSAKVEKPTGTEVVKPDIKSTDLSWAFGLGYLMPSGLGVDARFNLGLSNMYKDGYYPDGVTAKHHVGQIGVFYQFGNR